MFNNLWQTFEISDFRKTIDYRIQNITNYISQWQMIVSPPKDKERGEKKREREWQRGSNRDGKTKFGTTKIWNDFCAIKSFIFKNC